MNKIERLSGDYIRGYTKAVLDIIEIFEYIQSDLKFHHKNMNGKLSIMLLKSILKNREYIRERILERRRLRGKTYITEVF